MKSLRILCVDDSKSIHAVLKMHLEGVLKDFYSAFDGEQGLDFLTDEERRKNLDLVFLDWEMPKKTGPEILLSLKEKELLKTVPIVMLTSKSGVDDITKVLEIGASEYVMKPFTKEIILEKIKNVLMESI